MSQKYLVWKYFVIEWNDMMRGKQHFDFIFSFKLHVDSELKSVCADVCYCKEPKISLGYASFYHD